MSTDIQKKNFLNTLIQQHLVYEKNSTYKWYGNKQEQAEKLFEQSPLKEYFSSAQNFVYCINHNIEIQEKCPICGGFVKRGKSGYFMKYCGKEECRKELFGKKNPQRKIKGIRKWNTKKLRETIQSYHGDFYDLKNTYYIAALNKIKIGCPVHGNVEISTQAAIRGAGCGFCANKKNEAKSTPKTLSQEEFIRKTKEIHGDFLDLSKATYENNYKKVEVKCNECGSTFYIRPTDLWAAHGCPTCKGSRGEKLIKNFLEKNNILYEREKTFEGLKYKLPLRFDFYLPTYNICVEYNGNQHYSYKSMFGLMHGKENLARKAFKELQIRDNLKVEFCNKKENPELLIIQDLKEVENTLKNKLT